MRQIDNMDSSEIETLRLKGMLSSTTMTREERLAATLIGIKHSLEHQGGFEKTIENINAALKP